jgi:hypothetical protein
MQSYIVLLIDQVSHLMIWQVNSEVHISEETLIIMIAFFLGVYQTKVIECIIEDLLNVIQSLC